MTIPKTNWVARLQFLESVPLDKKSVKERLQARYPHAEIKPKHVLEYIRIMKAELMHAREMLEAEQKAG